MAIKRNKPEEIVTKLRQVEVLVRQGLARINSLQIFLRPVSLWRKATPCSPPCSARALHARVEIRDAAKIQWGRWC